MLIFLDIFHFYTVLNFYTSIMTRQKINESTKHTKRFINLFVLFNNHHYYFANCVLHMQYFTVQHAFTTKLSKIWKIIPQTFSYTISLKTILVRDDKCRKMCVMMIQKENYGERQHHVSSWGHLTIYMHTYAGKWSMKN